MKQLRSDSLPAPFFLDSGGLCMPNNSLQNTYWIPLPTQFVEDTTPGPTKWLFDPYMIPLQNGKAIEGLHKTLPANFETQTHQPIS